MKKKREILYPFGDEMRLRIRKMKLTLLLVFLVMATFGNSFSQVTLSLHFNKANIQEVLGSIEKKTDYIFLYKDYILNGSPAITVDFQDAKFEEVLKSICEQSNVDYEIRERQIILKEKADDLMPSVQQQPQKRTISGTVLDSKGLPIPGATILIKGTTVGITSDTDGNFQLSIPNNAKALVVSFIGMKTQEILINGQKIFSVILEDATVGVEEVVVVGYGTQKKISLVGAVSSIKAKVLKLPVPNLTNSLGGRVAGLVSVQRSGELGFDDAQIYIRGISTFTSGLSAPLTLVDGVPRSISNVDPEDIESFSILKDASATAIYGVRGANGVIIITTKSGNPGKASYNFRYTEGITQFTALPEFADGPTYMKTSNEASTTRGGTAVYSDEAIQLTQDGSDPYLYPNVDWMKEVFNKTGKVRNANANISGGTENATYYVSLGYYDEVGMYKTDALTKYDPSISLKRYNVSSNLSLKPSQTTTIKLGIQGYLNNVNLPAESVGNIFADAFFNTPVMMPLKYPDGKIADTRSGSLSNPWASLTQMGYANQWRSQIFSNLRVTQELPFITKGLSASVMFSFDAYNYTSNRYTKTPDTYLATGRDTDGNLLYDQTAIGSEFLAYGKSNNGNRTIYSEGSLNYSRDFGKHSLGGMILVNQSDQIDTYAGSLENSLPYRSRGVAGRFTYGFNDRYFVESNFGYNGSENFSPNNRYGFFPSGGLGWVTSNEDFFKSFKKSVQFLKFRFSHGIVGNSVISGRRFAYLATVSTPGGYSFGKTMGNGFAGKDFGEYEVNVKWETSKKTNLGVDMKVLDSKLSIQADFFKEQRTGIFLRRTSLPAYIGMINAPFGNVGAIDNKGFDASLNYTNNIGKVSLSLLGNFTYNINKVIQNDDPSWAYPWLERIGNKVGQRYGYIALGLFESDQEVLNSPRQTGDTRAGDIKFKDINGDGVIDSYDETPIGYGSIPEIVCGFGFTVGYKSFFLSALFQGAANVDYMLNGEGMLPFNQGLSRGNLFSNIDDRWSLENPDPNAFYPRLTAGSLNDNFATSTWWLKDANYLRLKTLQLSYNLPKNWMENVKFKSASVFLQGVNVFTVSPFKLWDVELGDGRGAAYPNTSSFSAGFNLNF